MQPAERDVNDEFSPASKPARSTAARLGGSLFTQLLALAVFVGFPALATAIAPVSWIQFERRDGRVSATARTCLLFVVPYKTVTIDPVTGLGDHVITGSVHRERRPGRDKLTKAEDEGFLVIRGTDQTAEVQVTPADLNSVIERSQAFLDDPQAGELKLFVVANWKFSILMGGLVSLLTVLYVTTMTLGLALKLIHLLQAALGVPPRPPPIRPLAETPAPNRRGAPTMIRPSPDQ